MGWKMGIEEKKCSLWVGTIMGEESKMRWMGKIKKKNLACFRCSAGLLEKGSCREEEGDEEEGDGTDASRRPDMVEDQNKNKGRGHWSCHIWKEDVKWEGRERTCFKLGPASLIAVATGGRWVMVPVKLFVPGGRRRERRVRLGVFVCYHSGAPGLECSVGSSLSRWCRLPLPLLT